MHAGTVEIYVGSGANLRFVELQSLGEHLYNFTHERVQVASDGNLDWVFGAMGGLVTKNFSDLDLVGRGAGAARSLAVAVRSVTDRLADPGVVVAGLEGADVHGSLP